MRWAAVEERLRLAPPSTEGTEFEDAIFERAGYLSSVMLCA
jgi:hypothetical protein